MMRCIAMIALTTTTLAGPLFAAPPSRAASGSLPPLNLQAVRLADAINFLRDASGLNFHVDWKALAAVNVTPDTTVSDRLDRVTLRKALSLLLADAAGGGDIATFYVDGGVVEITTRQAADQQLVTRTYAIDDLLADVPDFANAPNFQLQSTSVQGGQQGGGGSSGGGSSSGGGLFGSGSSGGGTNPASAGQTPAERAAGIIKLIEATIRPDIWADNGGTAHMTLFRGTLVVTAPRSVQEAIGGR